MTGRAHEQERLFKLDDRLPYVTEPEVLTRAPGQALHAGGERGQMLGVLAAQGLRGRHDQAIAGQDHGPLDLVHAGGEIIKQPAQLLPGSRCVIRVHQCSSCGASRTVLAGSSALGARGSGVSVLRARSHPLCKEASRLFACSGVRTGSGAGAADWAGLLRRCGDRFAWRMRRGRPRCIPAAGTAPGEMTVPGEMTAPGEMTSPLTASAVVASAG